MTGNHSIKNKAVDVKKALSKAELSKIQANKTSNNDSNQNTNCTPDWNTRNLSNNMVNDNWSMNRGSGGPPPMNMNGGIPPGGYGGPTTNWG